MKQIIHGIGKAILRDFKDPTKILDYTDLTDLSFESGYSADDITGGNKIFPIASFKNETTITVSATNATFHPEIEQYLDGSTISTGAVKLPAIKESQIPADGVIKLDEKPVAGSVLVREFTESSEAAPTKGQFKVGTEDSTVTFAKEDAGQTVSIVYEYMSSEETTNYSVTEKSISIPFQFDYIFPIYDENTDIVKTCVVRVYKMKSTSGLKLDHQHQSAFAPQFEATAQDPLRPDGHLWDMFIDNVKQ